MALRCIAFSLSLSSCILSSDWHSLVLFYVDFYSSTVDFRFLKDEYDSWSLRGTSIIGILVLAIIISCLRAACGSVIIFYFILSELVVWLVILTTLVALFFILLNCYWLICRRKALCKDCYWLADCVSCFSIVDEAPSIFIWSLIS